MAKRGIVVGGGGSMGAYGVGVTDYMISIEKKDWDIYVGTSTGNLIVPLLALSKMKVLKDVYTNITNDDVYSVNPFNKDYSFNILNAVWRLLRGKKSIGEPGGLKNVISDSYTQSDHDLIRTLGKKVYSTVTNASYNKAEFKYQSECSYSDYKDWMLASASIPLIFPPMLKEECEYFDGGVVDQVAIQKAIDEGCDIIDIIIFKPEEDEKIKWFSKGMFSIFLRLFGILLDEVTTNDILIGKLSGKLKNVTLNFYYTPYKLTSNSAIFDPIQMKKWYNLGYNYAKSKLFKQVVLSRDKSEDSKCYTV